MSYGAVFGINGIYLKDAAQISIRGSDEKWFYSGQGSLKGKQVRKLNTRSFVNIFSFSLI